MINLNSIFYIEPARFCTFCMKKFFIISALIKSKDLSCYSYHKS